MIWFIGIAAAVAAYLIGSINTSIILSRVFFGEDIRKSGSGNAGATNMLRTHGKKFAIATLIMDILKGVIAVLLALAADNILAQLLPLQYAQSPEAEYILGNLKYIAGFFVVLGHSFPIYFGFRGGKGVATGLGVILTLNWQVGLIVLALSLIIMAVSRYVSLGSVIGALLFPLLLAVFTLGAGNFDMIEIIMAAALSLLIIARHHSNISRLLHGNENKLFSKKQTKDS